MSEERNAYVVVQTFPVRAIAVFTDLAGAESELARCRTDRNHTYEIHACTLHDEDR